MLYTFTTDAITQQEIIINSRGCKQINLKGVHEGKNIQIRLLSPTTLVLTVPRRLLLSSLNVNVLLSQLPYKYYDLVATVTRNLLIENAVVFSHNDQDGVFIGIHEKSNLVVIASNFTVSIN